VVRHLQLSAPSPTLVEPSAVIGEACASVASPVAVAEGVTGLSLILAIDQGTSSTKACVYEAPAQLLGQGIVPGGRRVLADGGVEQDPFELVESCRLAARTALGEAGVAAAQLDGAALANQGESFLLFSPSGDPYTGVIGWQDTRCGSILDELDASGRGPFVAGATGWPPHTAFSAPQPRLPP